MAALPAPTGKVVATVAMAAGAAPSAATPGSAITPAAPGTAAPGTREEMFAKFQPWVLATYGDSAKTKTITLKKAARILALLRAGERGAAGEPAGSEAAKLRVWVKAKGLQLGELGEDELYVPTGTDKVSC